MAVENSTCSWNQSDCRIYKIPPACALRKKNERKLTSTDNWFWFYFCLVEKVVRAFLTNRRAKTLNQRKDNGYFLFTWANRGRFVDWANGKQNLGLVNFVRESRLPIAQIDAIYRKTAGKT